MKHKHESKQEFSYAHRAKSSTPQPALHDDCVFFPEKSPLTDNLYVEQKAGAVQERRVRGGEKKRRQGQGRDTSGRGSYLQSAGSLISDKNIVNQGSKEDRVWALCPQTDRQMDRRTDRISTSVSHFAGIYCICSKVPRLIIMGRQKSHPRPGSVRGSRVSALPSLLLSFIRPIAAEGGRDGGGGRKKID